jgi:hypothetical protein
MDDAKKGVRVDISEDTAHQISVGNYLYLTLPSMVDISAAHWLLVNLVMLSACGAS